LCARGFASPDGPRVFGLKGFKNDTIGK